MLRLYILVILFHAFIGWRLLPDLWSFGWLPAALVAGGLVLSAWLMPQALLARSKKHRALADGLVWAGSIAMAIPY